MGKSKNDGHPPATTVTIATRDLEARRKLEDAFAAKAKEYLHHFAELKLVDGAVTLFSLGVTFRDFEGVRYPQITDEQLHELVGRARDESDPNALDAHDAAIYIARLWMARRASLPDILLPLVLDALHGAGPKRKGGRPRAGDTILRAFMYAWAVFIHQNAQDIPLGRGKEQHKKRGWIDWSACDLVAIAFTRAGKHTTFQQVNSYCYDDSYWHIRAAASMMWQKGRRYEDPRLSFDFDHEAFCFGKP